MGLVVGILSSFVAKGLIGSASGASLLGVGGYYLHKKYIVKHPLLRYLINVTEKKFSVASLVSYEKGPNGMYYFKLKVPEGYSVDDMLKLKPAIEDKFDCEIQVWSEDTNFRIEMSTNPIPNRMIFDPYEIKLILQDYECAMYLGKSRLGDMVVDFTNNATPHLLFGGPTGGGKSNLINQGLCGMLQRYTPRELNLYLIDLKDGVELNPYKEVKHVKGFYETTWDVDDGLQGILLELKRRNVLFKSMGVKKLSEYNKVSVKKLPRILIIADEFAQFNNIMDRDLKKSVFTKWEELLQKGRSAGIHVMVGTQIADSDVFPKQIKGNIDARFGFKFTDPQHSKMITGGSELTYLPNVHGRGMFKLGSKLIQTQTPLIELEQMQETIKQYQVEQPVEQPKEKIEIKPVKEVKTENISAEKNFLPIIKEISPPPIEGLFISEESFLKEVKQ